MRTRIRAALLASEPHRPLVELGREGPIAAWASTAADGSWIRQPVGSAPALDGPYET